MGKGDIRWLSVNEAALQLHVHPETVRVWARKGLLPAKRNRMLQGAPLRIEQQDLIDFRDKMSGETVD